MTGFERVATCDLAQLLKIEQEWRELGATLFARARVLMLEGDCDEATIGRLAQVGGGFLWHGFGDKSEVA